MPTGSTSSRTVAALVTGVATTVHYALPDVITSRTARGWTKVALTTVALAAALPELRAAWATAREGLASGDDPEAPTSFGSLPARTRAGVLGVAGALLACSAGGVVLAERAAFRRGQARAAAGKRLPHTGPALLYGAVAGALWFVPEPPAVPPAG